MNIALWIIQGLLALLFIFAGGMKLVLPIEEMTKDIALPGLFLRFIGVAELLGGLGLVLPGLTGIRTQLTPSAAGLVIIMIRSRRDLVPDRRLRQCADPADRGVLLAFVAYGRSRLLPHRGSAQASALRRPPAA
jgi:hypothetical protein